MFVQLLSDMLKQILVSPSNKPFNFNLWFIHSQFNQYKYFRNVCTAVYFDVTG